MKRLSAVIALALTVLILSCAPRAVAQPAPRVYRMGFLAAGSAPAPVFRAFLAEMDKLGYVEERNLIVLPRYADGNVTRLPGLAREIVRAKVDFILTSGTEAAIAAKRATKVIPIVFNVADDPVKRGLVSSFAKPGGNVTGVVLGLYEDKQLQILKELVPAISRVSVVWDVRNAKPSRFPGARALGLDMQVLEVHDPSEFDRALASAAETRSGSVLVPDTAWMGAHMTRVAELAMKYRLPAISFERRFVTAGGLVSYGPKPGQNTERLAMYVDKILKGAKAGDLPVDQPAVFELFVNRKTATAFGLTIPPSILLRATEVIE